MVEEKKKKKKNQTDAPIQSRPSQNVERPKEETKPKVEEKPVGKTPQQQRAEMTPEERALLDAPKDPNVIEGGAIPRGDRLILGERDPQKIAEIRQKEGIPTAIQQQEQALLPEQQEQARQFAESAGLFEDQPEAVDLGGVGPASRIPLIGPALQANANVRKLKIGDEELRTITATPQGRMEVMRAAIEKEQIKEIGGSISRLGVVAESMGLGNLPLGIGEAVEKFVRTPKEDVEQLRAQLGELDSRMSSMTDSVSQGEMGNPFQAIKKIEEGEKRILEIQTRIQLLKQVSAELQSDPEQLRTIEEEINQALTTAFEAKQRAGEGAFVTPTEESLYFRLQNIR